MTTPNSLEPPRLAAWLLERFCPVVTNPALAGDLSEAFNQGRSPGWYRSGAIAGLCQEKAEATLYEN